MRLPILAGLALALLTAGCGGKGGVPVPALPPGDDWLELTSGEWLHGRLKSMDGRTVEFDSDKLKDLTLDWEDVKSLHTPRATGLVGDDNKVVVGSVVVDRQTVTVKDNGAAAAYPRGELRSLLPGDVGEKKYWSGNLMVGATYRTGNTNQTEVTVQADVQRRTPQARQALSYIGNYGTVGGTETSNNERVGLEFDRSLTKAFFIRPAFVQYYRDPLQNVAHQVTAAAGAGYYLFDEPRLEWMVFAGPAYQYTRFDAAGDGRPGDSSTPAFVVQSRFEKELTKRLDLLVTYQAIATDDDAGAFTQHVVGTLEFKLAHQLNFDLSVIWEHTNKPQPDASGRVPRKDDVQLVLSVGVKF
ncbi:MAG TPA: DUF481 domain-containing protein [Humisphaera sp.]